MTPTLRLLIADDQPLIRRGLALMLGTEEGIKVVGQAADGQQALALAHALNPDVVVMDLQMPRMGGVAATRQLAQELPQVRVVVLTTFDDDELVFEAVRAGAQAYLLKDAEEAEVLETVRAVHRGESRLSPSIARKVLDQLRSLATRGAATPATTAAAAPPPHEDPLTEKEEQVLTLIARGLSNKEIAERVFLAEGTVKNYVSRIMEKCHARSRIELAMKTTHPAG